MIRSPPHGSLTPSGLPVGSLSRPPPGASAVRYADDIAIFVGSRRSAERIYESVVAWIEKNLKLEVNRDKSGTGPSGGSSLSGFRIGSDRRDG